MNIEKIKDKIKKLLALSQDTSSPHEAAIAARQIQKMMAQYNLEMADVIAQELQDEDNLIKMDRESKYRRTPTYIGWIEVSLAQAFQCEVKKRYERIHGVYYDITEIYGYKTDVEVVKRLCTYILNQLEKLAKRVKVPDYYQRMGYSRRYMADWRKGAANEICARIKEFYTDTEETPCNTSDHETQTQLTLLKKDAIARKFGTFEYDSTSTTRYTQDGMIAGKMAAASINISQKLQEDQRALPHLQES